MGNKIMGKFRKNRFEGFREEQIQYISDKWLLVSKNDELSLDDFAEHYNLTKYEAQKIIEKLDVDQTGSVDFYKFKVGCSILCQSTQDETAKFLFLIYDMDKDGFVGPDEFKVFIRTIFCTLQYFDEVDDLSADEIAQKTESFMIKWDHNDQDGKLCLEEFTQMIRKDPDVLRALYLMGMITKDEMNLQQSHYNDIDSDLECEMERREQPRDERIERIKEGIEHTVTTENDHQYGLEDIEAEQGPPPWIQQVTDKVPSYYKQTPDQSCPPNASLELEYIYGYRCHDVRNNLKYDNKGRAIYHTAGVGIQMDPKTQVQKHFLEHSDDITCLDLWEGTVVTGQMGARPLLMVWDVESFRLQCVWREQLINGISHCCFSNDGSMVAALGMDDDHSLVIYDIRKGINYRRDPQNPDQGVVAFGKLTKAEVFDIKFAPGDYQIIVACMMEVNIIIWKDGKILSDRCIWGPEVKPSAAITIGFTNDQYITGMFTGQLLIWGDNNLLVRWIKAHSHPVEAMWTRSNGRGIITGGKRGLIYVWDSSLNKQYEIDMRDIGVKILFPPGPMITSICENDDGSKILVGTRRSEIVEVQLQGSRQTGKLLMQGHFKGELWGLAQHPTSQTFYTVGEDELLAQWDAKYKRIIRHVHGQAAAKTLHVSPNAKYLAVGQLNGKVLVYDPNSLKLIIEIKDFIDPDKEQISQVKFSPNSETLIVCYCPPKSSIAVYSTKNWKLTKEIKGIEARINCIDYSCDGKFIQVNTANYKIFYFDLSTGKAVQGETLLKDEKWSTWTCIYGWSMQGVWPPCSNGSDINDCDRSKDGNVVVTADDFGKIKLFKYPSPQSNSGFSKYTGHSSYVCGVRFLCDSQTVISVGGDELSIFQWKFTNEPLKLKVDHSIEEKSLEQSFQQEKEESGIFEQAEVDQGDQALAVKPFLGEVQNSIPTWYKPNKKRDNVLPNGNLSIHHVMGFRYFYILDEARNMCAFTDKGTVVFVAAALGVEVDIKTNVQTFFNKHAEDIVSFAMHPSRKICATGQMAQAGQAKQIDIFVWDIETKQQLANFREFHLRAVVLLQFSPDGTLLLSVGQDDDNSLAIHDWQANRLVVTSNVDKAKVNGVAWASNNQEFVTCGNKHIKFWKLNGRNVSGKMGQQSGKFESQYCVTYAFKNSIIVSGSGGGQLLVWKGGSSDKGVVAHTGKVQSLIMDDNKNLLYSGGMDGKVNTWSYEGGTLVKKQEIVSMDKVASFQPGITALDLQQRTGVLLIGTCGAQVYTYDQTAKKGTLVVQGHYGEELWGACTSPNSKKFVSGGADKTVRLWDIETRRMLAFSKFENDIRALDWAANNKFIVCADILGFIYLLDASTLEIKDKGVTKFTKMPKRQSTYWVEDIKISPDCKFCAFGAHGGPSPLEVWAIAYPKFGASKVIQPGLTSALLHLDWSIDSSITILNSQAYELKFVDMVGGKNARSSACKDVEFASWTCKLGFPVQGIFPSPDYSDVNTVCRSNSQKFLVTGEDTQKVVLFKYPVVEQKQLRKEYIGHSSHVTRVRFTYDDSFLVSTGGNDKCVIIWKTDFGAQTKQKHQEELGEEGDDGLDAPQPKDSKGKKKGQTNKTQNKEVQSKIESDDIFENDTLDQGDQFMACKPWMGAIKEPSQAYYNNQKEGFKPPEVEICVEYVYGYRTKDMRNNLFYLGSGKIVYNAAALGIVHDIEQNTQSFFDLHDDDITALDLNPADKMTVATGEIGAKPSIYVWDSETKEVKCKFKGVLLKGIIALNFTPSGKKLVAGGIDVDHSLAVLDVSGNGSIVWKDKSGPDLIIDIRFNDENTFTTVGVKHYYQWVLNNGQIKKTRGTFGPKSCNKLIGIDISGGDTVCGAADGTIQIWKGTNLSKQLDNIHTQSVDCITSTKDYVFSGGRDSKINVFTKTFEKLTVIDCNQLLQGASLGSIRAIDQKDQNLLIGTLGSDIYEIQYDTPKITAATKFSIKNDIMHAHYCPNLQWTNEVWGLSVFNNDPNKIATCSDDGTLRVWDIQERRQIQFAKLTFDKDGKPEKLDHATGDLADLCKGRTIAVAPKDKGFVVGCKDGTIRIFDENLKQTKVFKKAKEWVSDIKFSPDGTTLVHGSHDNALYAQKWPSLQMIGKTPMKKHSSYITHFDFSCDGVNLHSTCGAYELLFWDVAQGKQITGGATALRDEKWSTWTVTLGWPVQGIWPECADGTDINSVDRSHGNIKGDDDLKNYYLLASGDDFSHVRILRYPSLKKSSQAVVGRGHSSHVTQVKWNADDTKIFSTGGEDQCVIQWIVKKK